MNAVIQTKPKLPGLISTILVIALGASLAKLMWLVIAPAPTFSNSIQNQDAMVTNQKQQANYGKLIADQHIFGEAEKKAVVKDKKPIEVVKTVVPTKLNLKLHGIIAYKSKQGYALISLNNGSQKVYGKDESIEEGVTVTNILPDKVILNNRGQTEELLLPVDKSNTSSRIDRSRESLGGNATSPPASMTGNDGAPDLYTLREKIISNPGKLQEVVNVSPAIVDGQFIGFRIYPGSNRKLFQQLDFRPNDIITEVNGTILDDAGKGVIVLGEIAQATDITVKVKRGDQELLIEHSF